MASDTPKSQAFGGRPDVSPVTRKLFKAPLFARWVVSVSPPIWTVPVGNDSISRTRPPRGPPVVFQTGIRGGMDDALRITANIDATTIVDLLIA
ncbi:MAG: hypothetical protein L0323_04370 [Planctomycetes bacterium]|nr:hypothetical protein [Planctomycetota bacterium]